MSSRVTIGFQERATSFDVILGPVLQRRDADKDAAAMAMRRHRHGPPGTTAESTLDTLQPCVLGGLDVTIGSGSTLRVHPGRAVITNPARQTLTRPGGWSGRVDADDYTLTRAELTSLTSVTPSLPLGAALLAREWWLVSAGMTEKTIETTSQLETLNASGGWDKSSGPKVKQHVLVPVVTRGTPGGPVPALPAGHIALAWVMVPAGATNLTEAVIFDTRRIAGEVTGANMVEGRWDTRRTGVGPALRASVQAVLGGELLEANISLQRSLSDLLEPGASWDGTASPSAPKTAWIYLAKVRGVVPRPTRRGAHAFGAHPGHITDGAVTLAGAIVLSPKAPRIGGYDSQGRWDLRASAPLALSDVADVPGYALYAYAGLAADADDAICVGFVRYVGVTGSGTPTFEDAVSHCDDGWHSGEGIAMAGGGSSPWSGVAALNTGGSGAGLTIGVNREWVGARLFPIDAARAQVTATTSELAIQCAWGGRMAGVVEIPVLEAGVPVPIIRRVVEGSLGYIESTSEVIASARVPTPATFLTRAGSLIAVRFPYGVPLVT